MSVSEVIAAIRAGRKSGSPAPGLNGIAIGVWRCVSPVALETLTEVFTACLKDGVFPRKWKRAKLILIPKGEEGTRDGRRYSEGEAYLPIR